jgi:hypothetical protein
MTYIFPDGRQLRHILGATWQLLAIDGAHISYLIVEDVDYSGVRGPR